MQRWNEQGETARVNTANNHLRIRRLLRGLAVFGQGRMALDFLMCKLNWMQREESEFVHFSIFVEMEHTTVKSDLQHAR